MAMVEELAAPTVVAADIEDFLQARLVGSLVAADWVVEERVRVEVVWVALMAAVVAVVAGEAKLAGQVVVELAKMMAEAEAAEVAFVVAEEEMREAMEARATAVETWAVVVLVGPMVVVADAEGTRQACLEGAQVAAEMAVAGLAVE